LNENLIGFIVGNKCDLLKDKKINEAAVKLAKKLNLGYIQTSAFTGENIDEAFKKLGHLLRKY